MTSLILRPSRQIHSLVARRLPHAFSASSSSSSSALPRRFSSSTAGAQAETQDLPTGQTADASSSDPTSTQNKKTLTVEDQLAQKDAQLNEYKDLYIRARADFENLQKITSREKAQAKEYAIQGFARDLVSNIDVLQLALNSVPEPLRTVQEDATTTTSTTEGAPESRKHLADLWAGVQSTKSLLEKTLALYGVTPFNPVGQQFDPNRHEAMYQAQVPGKEPNSVLNCSKVGWMLRDRVLRPAQVGVVQGSDSS
ncbi:Mitochondrial matrix cochaperone [Puccinia graminis f. sp. tritici]|uniref:GrpE protein homolog, mitochondrial n=1 Tax=Puccinia graminis f. sp. tritici TaxID=56615 RepID=A0A5B0Q2H2_PUCGR|nr:Mitochondrial matrix cochaperone [Puccinia graminis f. sp. tritici]KAA1124854.1 Mitochondrial matrix cochaperone [Puccinia graminis f. sp. tritici]